MPVSYFIVYAVNVKHLFHYLVTISSYFSSMHIVLRGNIYSLYSQYLDLCFCFVTGTIGIVDYTNYDDMKYAVSVLLHAFSFVYLFV